MKLSCRRQIFIISKHNLIITFSFSNRESFETICWKYSTLKIFNVRSQTRYYIRVECLTCLHYLWISLWRNYFPVSWIIDASDSNTKRLHQQRLFIGKYLLSNIIVDCDGDKNPPTWSILTKWLKWVKKGRLAPLGFCLSWYPRDMNNYCYGSVKRVISIAKGYFTRSTQWAF